MEEKDQFERVKPQATKEANKQLVRLLAPGVKRENRESQMQQMQDMMSMLMGGNNQNNNDEEEVTDEVRNQRMDVAEKLNKGLLEDREVTIEVEQAPKANPMSDMMVKWAWTWVQCLMTLCQRRKLSVPCQ